MKLKNLNELYWKKGNGAEFLDWADMSEKNVKDNFDVNWFYQYDDETDKLMSNWMANSDFGSIMKNLHLKSANLPDDFIEYEKRFRTIPEWVDFDLISEACKLSERSGLLGLLILRNYSLLAGYNFITLVKPLVATGSLAKGAAHRIFNTLGFWIDTSRTSEDSQKLRLDTCLRVRLIHSASRLMIQKMYADWDYENYGTPINHADQIITSAGFSIFYLFGLSRFKYNFSEKEEQGIYHLWKYVSYLLGVPAEIIPDTRKDIISFIYHWTQYEGSPDQDSLALAKGLYEENTPISLLKFDIIKENMSYVHKSVSDFLMDEGIKQNLKIPEVRFKSLIPSLVKTAYSIPRNRETLIKEGAAQQKSVYKDYKQHA